MSDQWLRAAVLDFDIFNRNRMKTGDVGQVDVEAQCGISTHKNRLNGQILPSVLPDRLIEIASPDVGEIVNPSMTRPSLPAISRSSTSIPPAASQVNAFVSGLITNAVNSDLASNDSVLMEFRDADRAIPASTRFLGVVEVAGLESHVFNSMVLLPKCRQT